MKKSVLIIFVILLSIKTLAQVNSPSEKTQNESWDTSLYGELAENYEKPDWGFYTLKKRTVYAHVKEWPKDDALTIDKSVKVIKAILADFELELEIASRQSGDIVKLPVCDHNTVDFPVVKLYVIPNEDWANLKKYQSENTLKSTSEKIENRVVFMGNSITEKWKIYDLGFFKNNPYICRGISGQTSAQMLLRFRQDVIALKPGVVVIHAGTNDIAGNRGPITLNQIAGNIFSMAELARANGIEVILASVLPTTSYSWRPGIKPANKIIALNNLLKSYAEKQGIIYLDYYSAMVNEQKGLKKSYGRDTVHPSIEGYKIMEPLVMSAIENALKSMKH